MKHILLSLLLGSFGLMMKAQSDPFTMTQLGPNQSLNFPWEITYGPDGFLWVTEREDGQVTRVDPRTGQQDVILTLTDFYVDARQDGLLGMALHPDLGQGKGRDYVYLSYTYWVGQRRQKIVRFSYQVNPNGTGQLSQPQDLLIGLPSSNDHNSGRLVLGPDQKLYYTLGDQGSNQGRNKCNPLLSQALPTQSQVDQGDYRSYPGKILRMNLDGSIPADNPLINGVRSHIFTYGHRNPQGLAFARNGLLYSHEHGHKTDDEINLINPGKNYGWPFVAGFIDNQAYTYCDWSSANNCDNLDYSSFTCPGTADEQDETDWSHPDFQPPMGSFFTVPNNYDFDRPDCTNSFICWPTIAPSSMEIYEGFPFSIQGWDKSLLISSRKKGLLYRFQLSADGTQITSDTISLIRTQNRYRDFALDPNGSTIYVITDNDGRTSTPTETNTQVLLNPGTILRFDYAGTALGTPQEATQYDFSLWQQNQRIILTWPRESSIDRSVSLFDLNGRLLAKQRSRARGISFSSQNMAPGVYWVKVQSPSRPTVVRKVLLK